VIHEQGRGKLNPTYSEGRSYSFLLRLGMLREGPALNEAELVDLMDKKNPLITGGKNVLRDVFRATNFNLDGNFDS